MSEISDIPSDNIEYDYGMATFDYSEQSSEYNEMVNGVKKTGHSLYHKKRSYEPILIKRYFPPNIQEMTGKKYVLVPVYESSISPNRFIRNAITGVYTPYRIGSQYENHFFKVCWAVGENGNKTPLNLFFDSPRDFEEHFITKVSDTCKKRWRENKLAEYHKYRSFTEKTDVEMVPI